MYPESRATAAPEITVPSEGAWCLEGAGEAATLARSIDWARTPLGPVARWPACLKAAVATVLNSRHPMFIWWGEELVQLYNDAYVPSFGRGKHPAAMGQRGADCWQEIWPIIQPQIEDVMRHGRPSWNEDQLVPIQRNGRLEEVYWTYGYSPLFDDDGRIGGTLVVCTETTVRVRAARRLSLLHALTERVIQAHSSEELHAQAVKVLGSDAADLPFLALYAPGGQQVLAALGLAPDAALALGRLLHGTLQHGGEDAPASRVQRLQEPLVSLQNGASIEEVLIVPCAESAGAFVFGLNPAIPLQGSYREFILQVVAALDAARARIAAAAASITARNERDNLLLKAPVPTAVLVGAEHVFYLANQRYLELVGRNDIVGRTYRDVFPELIGTELPGILNRVYATGEPYVTEETWLSLVREGQPTQGCFTFNLEATRDLQGRVYGIMVVAVEITAQALARQELSKAAVEREQLVRELQTASRAKDEFLAMLGHELRNPLTPIVTTLDLIRLRADGPESKEHATIRRQVTHMTRLVDDLLDVAKIVSGKVELKRQWIEIRAVLGDAVEMASPLLDQRKHRFELEVDTAQMPRYFGDPVRLAQCVANLLTNAARYTPMGGRIRLCASSAEGQIEIRVRDNGRGIAPELMPGIFGLFVQGERSEDRPDGGLGIGLALVRNLIGLHGGVVEGHSAGVNQGSEFTIRLPLQAPVAAPALAETSSAGPAPEAGGLPRVMLVDDNVDALETLAEVLMVSGFEVATAQSPAEALKLAPQFAPDVAILDVGLPGMDGYQLAAELRNTLGDARPLRLITLSGYGGAADRQRSTDMGLERHLVKPVDLDELIDILTSQPHAA